MWVRIHVSYILSFVVSARRGFEKWPSIGIEVMEGREEGKNYFIVRTLAGLSYGNARWIGELNSDCFGFYISMPGTYYSVDA